MSSIHGTTAALLLALACTPAFAQNAGFGVSLRVQPEPDTAAPAAELPDPPQARPLPPGHYARRLLYAGPASEARRFYAERLPQLGFRLAADRSDAAVWERDGTRAELRFQPVAGEAQHTAILLTLSRTDS